MATIYFKTPKTSPYGQKFQQLIDLGKRTKIEILKFMSEIGAEDSYLMSGRCHFHTGIVGVHFKNEPDMKVWKKIAKYPNYYQPRMSSKLGKEFDKRIDSFTKIERDEIGEVFGYSDFLKFPGFMIGKDYFGVAMDPEWKHPMPKEFEEITFTEYENL